MENITVNIQVPTHAYASYCDGCGSGALKMTEVTVPGSTYPMHYCCAECREVLLDSLDVLLKSVSGVDEKPNYQFQSIDNHIINPQEDIKNPEKIAEINSYMLKYRELIDSGRVRCAISQEYTTHLMAIAHWFPS